MQQLEVSVLVVEDEKDIGDAVASYLDINGIPTLTARNLSSAQNILNENNIRVVILDLMLGSENGLDLLDNPAMQNVVTIVTSAKGELSDRVLGYEKGILNYLVKPYSMKELLTIVKTQLVRQSLKQSHQEKTLINSANNVITQQTQETPLWKYQSGQWQLVAPNGKTIKLTHNERSLIEVLLNDRGRPVKREAILQAMGVLGQLDDYGRLEACVKRLRQKVSEQADYKLPVQTARGVGYALVAEVEVLE